MSYLRVLGQLLRTNLFQTIRFNMKMLPFQQAVRLPVWFYGKVVFRSLEGKVEIKTPIAPGMIMVGVKEWYVSTSLSQCIWTVNGTIVFNGPIRFLQGSYVLVARNATLELGTEGSFMGSDLKIMCYDRIRIGNSTHITWGIQMMDTSFHYMENEPKKLTAPIEIGDRVWIGNNCTISKGAQIPDDTVVAQCSLVNKNFLNIRPYTLLAGSPASVKAEGFHRVWDERKQKELDIQFRYDRTHL